MPANFSIITLARGRGFTAVERKNLCGIEQPFRVEHGLDPHLQGKLGGRELHRHQIALLDADAVLAGQAAADLDAQLQDFGAAVLRLARSRQDRWRCRGSADAGCRRRHGRCWRPSGHAACRSCRWKRAPRAAGRAGSCHPCSSSRRCGRWRRTPICGPSRWRRFAPRFR